MSAQSGPSRLHQSALLDAIFASTGWALVYFDPNLRALRVNARLAAAAGLPEGAIVGRSLREILPHLADQLEPPLRAALLGRGKVENQEVRGTPAGGPTPVDWQMTALPVSAPDGEIVGVCTVFIDVTERRGTEPALPHSEMHFRATAENRQLEARLLQARKMEGVGRLAGGVAHDFNNLLTIILSAAAALREGLLDRSDLLVEVAEIETAGARAVSVTRQLLTFARRHVSEPRLLNIDELVDNLSNMLHRLLGEDIELDVRLQAGSAAVHADPGQIEQAIVNLANNARDAMPGGGKLTVATREHRIPAHDVTAELTPGQYVIVAVTDTGVGLSAYVREHLFEPFFTTKPPGIGTGLGLATCYGIMEQVGGRISVSSEPGMGTTFSLTFPAVPSGRDEAPRAPGAARGETILLVEDESAVRSIAARVLRRQGYVVLEAGDPMEAIDVARRHEGPLHLLLTDVIMPKMGGRDLARTLTAEIPMLRVLYTSGYTADAMGRQGELDSGVHFLPKPYVPSALTKKVRDVLDAAP